MYIINSGGWYVGNSAVIEWLSKFQEVEFIHGDLNVLRLEDSIMDLILEPDLIVKRDIVRRNKLACFKGLGYAVKSQIGKIFNKGFSSLKKLEFYLQVKYYIFYYKALTKYEKNLRIPGFNEGDYWRNWLSELANLTSKNKKNEANGFTVLQNPFFYDETFSGHKDVWPSLLKPYKLIFVHRDPYDQLSDIIREGALNDSSWERFHGNTDKLESLERFCEISKRLYQGRLRLMRSHPYNDVIAVSFEDFILKHKEVSVELMEFLKLPIVFDNWDYTKSLSNIGKGRSDPAVLKLIDGRDYMLDELYKLRRELEHLQKERSSDEKFGITDPIKL